MSKSALGSCPECQVHMTKRREDMLTTMYSWTIFEWITMDVVHMPKGKFGCELLVIAREYLIEWVEARALRKNDLRSIA
jgi:hypothetical protein